MLRIPDSWHPTCAASVFERQHLSNPAKKPTSPFSRVGVYRKALLSRPRLKNEILAAILVVVASVVLLTLFLAPMIYVLPPAAFQMCSRPACGPFPEYGSLFYWAFHVGGVWMTNGQYVVMF